ncbi:MAG: polyphosphate:AMP phosphotransferase [Defluviicoccus sp.]|nr:polyphosphate:AMP phosphotransferase [Defluviicoccus sp.]MDG4591474.1 polyphosphate:AMP phosphotransferase [Defluviicoccus sp.]
MFESAAQVHKIDKATFKAEEAKLREALLDAQFDLIEQKRFAVLILLAGIDGAGKSAALARLNEWLDPRHVETAVIDEPSPEEAARPPHWRYWRTLPAKGKIGILVGSWYREAIALYANGGGEEGQLERELAVIGRFETMLADEGLLVIKLWLHLSRADQKKRFKEIDSIPGGGRHVVEHRWMHKNYEKLMPVMQNIVRLTSSGDAPWVVVPSADEEYRDLMIGQTVLAAMRKRLDIPPPPKVAAAPVVVAGLDRKTALDALDLSVKLDEARYDKELARYQQRIARLTDAKAFRDVALVVAFEGTDAAGKGGTIRRLTRALDPRKVKVYPIAAPTDEEKAQPYLWRFWRRIPAKGQVAIFDRTWYGRVLVERVEGFCSEADWLRAYAEINDFEEQLRESGVILAKFWLAISKEEQLRRFQDREKVPYKRYKITDEDWRNREKWDAYTQAIGDMVDRTSTDRAPWTLVSSEDKNWARVQVLKTLSDSLEAAL